MGIEFVGCSLICVFSKLSGQRIDGELGAEDEEPFEERRGEGGRSGEASQTSAETAAATQSWDSDS